MERLVEKNAANPNLHVVPSLLQCDPILGMLPNVLLKLEVKDLPAADVVLQ
jgi:hypothetical protein